MAADKKKLDKKQKLRAKNISTLFVEDFARLFGIRPDEFSPEILRIIRTRDFRYTPLQGEERSAFIDAFRKRIADNDFWVSGSDKKDRWETGWSENLEEYRATSDISKLIPKYVRPNQILRLDYEYIKPFDVSFEFNIVDVWRQWVFGKYLASVDVVYEFGCGSCQHIVALAKRFPEKKILGFDWAESSHAIIKELKVHTPWKIDGGIFDFYAPPAGFSLEKNSAAVTIGAMEQLGKNFDPFLKFLLIQRPSIIVHLETIEELYDPARETDELAIEYVKKRNYLRGYLTRLRELEKRGTVEIMRVHRFLYGGPGHDSYSLMAWRPK